MRATLAPNGLSKQCCISYLDISLKIRRIEVIGECKDGDPASSLECQFAPANIGVEKFLDLASIGDHDLYCLSYVFAHRDFSGGVLGLAWIGDGK